MLRVSINSCKFVFLIEKVMKTIENTRISVYSIFTLMIVFFVVSCNKNAKSYSFETAIVKKGSIINTITATGTVEADTTVLIGTQVSGVVKKVYVDFNSIVKKGQLLAEIDKIPLETQVQQAQASLDDSKSEVAFQSAAYERYKVLLEKKLVAQADYDQVKYNYDKALANLKTAQAGFDKAMVNLNYASIYSPIDGVVLNRAIDQGQTVAASFSTPNLFTIANNLTQMQVQANVDEADIGQLNNGQPVDFTVDAFPTEIFKGVVRQIRLQPVVTSNVVTYTVIVNALNPEKKLMPGMTANITVLVQKLDSVLVVPGRALRFTPDADYLTEYETNVPPAQRQNTGVTGERANYNERQRAGGAAEQTDTTIFISGVPSGIKPVTVWVKTADRIHRVHVVTGAMDGTNTEIKSGLRYGEEVILSMSLMSKSATGSESTTRSPFMPQRPAQRGKVR